MSIESLLLVAFLVVIPLLERLVRVLRSRNLPRPADLAHLPAPPRPAPPRPPVPEIAPDALGASESAELLGHTAPPTPASPPLLAARSPATERFTSRERTRARRGSEALPAAPVFVAPAPQSRRHSTSRLGITADLRRSIVMMSILGPCKALDHDGGHE